MSKTTTSNSATKSAAASKTADAPALPKGATRPLAPKARFIMVALLDGPKVRKEIVEFCIAKGWKIDPTATTSYIGSVNPETRAKWDRVARDPENKSWNHVSLLGLDLVDYNVSTKQFSLKKDGEPLAKKIAEELKAVA